MNEEEKKKYEAFKYWLETNTEKGVTSIPDNLCKSVIKIIEIQEKMINDLAEYGQNCYFGSPIKITKKELIENVRKRYKTK